MAIYEQTIRRKMLERQEARIAELEGMWTEIDVALANAERSAIDHAEEMPRLFYARLRDRLRKVFLEKAKP